MLKKSVIYLALAAYSTNSFADCSKPVTPLTQGEQAPCTGFLFSPAKELELRLRNEDYNFLLEQSKLFIQQKESYKKELEQTEQIVEKERQKAELWRKVAEDTTLKYTEVQERRGTRDWLFLGAGVLLTIGAGYALGQAAK